MTRCAIMQPTFIPWLGYFDLIEQADVFIFLDDVQLARRSWQVRNRIKTANGETMLSVPIAKTQSRDQQLILDAQINDNGWNHKALESIKHSYRKSPYYESIYPHLESHLKDPKNNLANLNIALIQAFCSTLNINSRFLRSSELDCDHHNKSQYLVSLCQAAQADHYHSPQGSADYLEATTPGGPFPKANITLSYQNYIPQEYPQRYKTFIPYLSIIDLLFNCSPEESKKVILAGRLEDLTSKQMIERLSL